jgi:hypothetical protein
MVLLPRKSRPKKSRKLLRLVTRLLLSKHKQKRNEIPEASASGILIF